MKIDKLVKIIRNRARTFFHNHSIKGGSHSIEDFEQNCHVDIIEKNKFNPDRGTESCYLSKIITCSLDDTFVDSFVAPAASISTKSKICKVTAAIARGESSEQIKKDMDISDVQFANYSFCPPISSLGDNNTGITLSSSCNFNEYIDFLPEINQQILQLSTAGHSQSEISGIVGVSPKRVREIYDNSCEAIKNKYEYMD